MIWRRNQTTGKGLLTGISVLSTREGLGTFYGAKEFFDSRGRLDKMVVFLPPHKVQFVKDIRCKDNKLYVVLAKYLIPAGTTVSGSGHCHVEDLSPDNSEWNRNIAPDGTKGLTFSTVLLPNTCPEAFNEAKPHLGTLFYDSEGALDKIVDHGPAYSTITCVIDATIKIVPCPPKRGCRTLPPGQKWRVRKLVQTVELPPGFAEIPEEEETLEYDCCDKCCHYDCSSSSSSSSSSSRSSSSKSSRSSSSRSSSSGSGHSECCVGILVGPESGVPPNPPCAATKVRDCFETAGVCPEYTGLCNYNLSEPPDPDRCGDTGGLCCWLYVFDDCEPPES